MVWGCYCGMTEIYSWQYIMWVVFSNISGFIKPVTKTALWQYWIFMIFVSMWWSTSICHVFGKLLQTVWTGHYSFMIFWMWNNKWQPSASREGFLSLYSFPTFPWFTFTSCTIFLLKLSSSPLSPCSEALDGLRSVIDQSKGLKVPAVRPLVLAAEENLHNMVVDLDKVVTKVRTLFCSLCTTR